MRSLNIHGAGDVRLDPKPPPQVGDNDVVVNVKACGICGSDLTYIKHGGINRAEGGVTPIGHEAAGEVAAVGRSVQGVQVGQRVVINPMQTSTFIGSGGPEGAFTEAVLVGDVQPGVTLLPIPDDLPYEVAALAEPLAVALHGVNRTQARPGDKVAVFGCGPIGLGMVLWLVDRGVTDVVALDLAPERLECAKALGARAVVNPGKEDVRARLAELHGATHNLLGAPVVGTDVFMDAAGAPNLISDIIGMGKQHARLVVTAVYMKPQALDMNAFLLNEMSITTAVGYPTEMPDVVAALPRVKDKAASIISHRYRFDDVLEAFAVAGRPQSAKVMIQFEDATP
ncbi:alcohol dehydrogenase catalytic domain-containing protein [Phenylobacterium sp. LjRoot225]|uniref:zinc-dependent alcohol dehydrogenase n=1 Tax=Phenylobacterium sp. LjRoot225 TaxID=3342285 RepID=UPI003ECF54C4